MDAFEQVIEQILAREGYWTRTELKVDLTKEEKVEIGRPTAPRWELDVVGYRPKDNKILVVECKSYLDSPGVHVDDLQPSSKRASRYKLFTEPVLRKVVFRRLARQLRNQGLCTVRPKVRLGLAAGKVAGSVSDLERLFAKNNWRFLTPDWIRERLLEIPGTGYENEVANVVAKLLFPVKSKRGRSENTSAKG